MSPRRDPHVAPVVKWAGGKRQLLDEILPLLPARIRFYCEPFVGGGALLFARQPRRALVNDLNCGLIELYAVIRDDIDALLADLLRHENTPEYFYALRDLDRDAVRFAALSPVQRASRLLYLNKTCFNGLFRVNASGQFNTPFGSYRNPTIADEPTLRAVHRYLSQNAVELRSEDFERTLSDVPRGGFVYLDPPYDPVSETAHFTGYQRGGFGRAEQLRLRRCCDDLHRRGVRFLLSNSATPFIRGLYADFDVHIVKARRSVNRDAGGRGPIEEVLVRNYGTQRRRMGTAL